MGETCRDRRMQIERLDGLDRAQPMNQCSHVKLLEIAGEVAEWLKAAVC
jgi:hypothetical protein